MTDGVLVALISGAFMVIVTGIGIVFSRRKNRADFASTLVSSAEKIVDLQNERIDELEAHTHRQDLQLASLADKVEDLETENKKLRRHNQILYTQVIESGGTPVSWEAMGFLEGDAT